ncbi:MAG TPA: hypothetical protein VD766_04900 [Solirubrobacterales bacterium]|nr:hypothetical protein [Solirubrobacterales bacterium]
MIDFTRVRVLGAVAVVIGALSIASVALAASPPKPSDPTVVPGVSLGGVSLGQDVDEAQTAWVAAGDCSDEGPGRICNYGSVKKGSAALLAPGNAVEIASIMAPSRDGEFVFKGPLMKFGTAKGDLGLGDKLEKIAKRYPTAKVKDRFLIYKEGDTRMTFFASELKTGRVTQIILGRR